MSLCRHVRLLLCKKKGGQIIIKATIKELSQVIRIVDDQTEHQGPDAEKLVLTPHKAACKKFYGYCIARTERTEDCQTQVGNASQNSLVLKHLSFESEVFCSF